MLQIEKKQEKVKKEMNEAIQRAKAIFISWEDKNV